MTLLQVIKKAEELVSEWQFDTAIKCYREWLSSNDSETELHYIALLKLGILLYRSKKYDDAIVAYQESLKLKPDFSDAKINLDLALKAKKQMTSTPQKMTLIEVMNKTSELTSQWQFDAAVNCYKEWILSPGSEAHLVYAAFFNMGTILQKVGRIDEAITAYEESLKLKPDFTEATVNLKVAIEAKKSIEASQKPLTLLEVMAITADLTKEGKFDSAITYYKDWLESSESETQLRYIAYFNIGTLYQRAKENDKALTAYNEALKLKPDLHLAHLNKGFVLEAQGFSDEALNVWKGTLQPVEEQVQLLKQIGRLLEIKREYDEEEKYLRRCLLLSSEEPDVIQHFLHIRQKQCKWPILEDLPGIDKETLLKSSGPLGLLAYTDDPAVQLEIIKLWISRTVPKDLPRLSPISGYQHDKLRVGYISCDFRWHAVSILTAELFERHNKERFEIYGFDYSDDDKGILRRRVIGAMDHHLPIHSLSNQQAAELIREHEIDILIDLTGLTSGGRPEILAYKPAPIQMSYLGFVGTSGMPEIDYIIADRFVFPEELGKDFVERPLYLPEVYQANDSTRVIGPAPSRESCALPEDAFVYCSFNGNFKITPDVFAVWMRILKRVPKSVLWLIADNDWAKNNLREAAQAQGVDVDRLIFAQRVQPSEYLARYKTADLLLDTSPYNAGTTASDALWAGLPVLTCPGRAFASRMAGSLLNAVGLNELIADDWQAYEDIAVRLAEQPKMLKDCKKRLEKAKKTSPLFDSERFVKNFEDVLYSLHNNANLDEKVETKEQETGKRKKKH